MKLLINRVFLIVFSVVLFSCESKENNGKPLLNTRSPLNQIIVIASGQTWDNGFKSFILDSLIKPRKGMFFAEPEFSVHQFSTIKLYKNKQKFPNYIIINKGDNNIEFKNDVYVNGQTIVIVTGNTMESVEKLLRDNKKHIFNQFHSNDKKMWSLENAGKYHSPCQELKKMGVLFRIPLDYTKVRREKDFVHYQYDVSDKTRNRSANFTVITKSYGLDSIALEDVLGLRDIIGRKYVKSSQEGSYMETHRLLDDLLNFEVIKDTHEIKVYKTVGMWSMKNDIKGGDFVNYIILDKINDKLFMFDGFSFVSSSGNTNNSSIFYRRDLLTELEFIFDSYKLINSENH